MPSQDVTVDIDKVPFAGKLAAIALQKRNVITVLDEAYILTVFLFGVYKLLAFGKFSHLHL